MTDKGWRFNRKELKYIQETLESGFSASASGTFNERLESEFAKSHDIKYAITSNSGTSTLHMALHAFGVASGDEVLIPALAPAMCGYAVWHCGAVPVYVDVKLDTFLMDPNDLSAKITSKSKAIMPVHLYGLMCDMNTIMDIANKNNLYVIEDCAQCFFARDEQGRLEGSIGHVGSWSFENSKHLSTGDGGIVATSDETLAQTMRQFGGVGFKNLTADSGKVRISRDKFQDPSWKRHNMLAYNYRLPELCAAVGLAQLEHFEELIEKRIKMGLGYLDVIRNSDTDLLIPQQTPDGFLNTYYTFAARYTGQNKGIPWQSFRKKYIEFGGDGIYAAWQTINNEPAFKDNKLGWGIVSVAETLQNELMQFTTNQSCDEDMNIQKKALQNTLSFFS
jgi:perosamine synthetase